MHKFKIRDILSRIEGIDDYDLDEDEVKEAIVNAFFELSGTDIDTITDAIKISMYYGKSESIDDAACDVMQNAIHKKQITKYCDGRVRKNYDPIFDACFNVSDYAEVIFDVDVEADVDVMCNGKSYNTEISLPNWSRQELIMAVKEKMMKDKEYHIESDITPELVSFLEDLDFHPRFIEEEAQKIIDEEKAQK